jgi:hypothetical protein
VITEKLPSMSASIDAAEVPQKRRRTTTSRTPAGCRLPGSLARPSAEELEMARELVRSARERGTALTGPGGRLKALTKTVIETALDEQMADHLGYDKHDPAGRGSGNSRNGTCTKTVLTDNCGPVEIEVPRDRNGNFEVRRRRGRRLRSSRRSRASPTPRSAGCGATRGSSSPRSWTTTWRSARCSARPTPIESLNARYRRGVSVRGHFSTEQAVMKCLYLVTRSLDPKGTGQTRWTGPCAGSQHSTRSQSPSPTVCRTRRTAEHLHGNRHLHRIPDRPALLGARVSNTPVALRGG